MTELIPPSSPNVAPPPNHPPSPHWGLVPKLVAGLVTVALAGALISRFRDMIGPLLFALIFAYLMSPLLNWVTAKTKLSWGMAVNLIFLVLFFLLVAGLTAAVVGIVQQSQGLYRMLVDILPDLPTRLQTLLQTLWTQPLHVGGFTIDLSKPIAIGGFQLDLSPSNLTPLMQQVVAAIQPLLGQAGGAVGSLASVTASMFGWLLFLLVISYYLLHDLKNMAPTFTQIVPAGYAYDAQRLTAELGPIWNAFFRGQITLAIVMGGIVGVAMGLLGVRYAPVLGLVAAAAEFIPIIGPIISALTGVLIALFQPGNEFGMFQLYYAGVVLAAYVIIQQLDGNFLGPRIVGGSLNLHPAAVIIGAFIAANLAGMVGLVLAAPLLATLRLFGGYVYRKLFDLDPWPAPAAAPPAPPPPKSEPPRWLEPLITGVRRLMPRAEWRKPKGN